MTLALWAVVIAAYILAVAATRRIAGAKGLPPGNWTLAVILLGPLALIGVVFAKPADGSDRLAWWQRDATSRPWAVLAGLGLVAVVAAVVYTSSQPDNFDGNSLEPQITDWLTRNGAPGATVDCPDNYPGDAGYTFLCSATDHSDSVSVQVTVLNDKGQVNWLVLG